MHGSAVGAALSGIWCSTALSAQTPTTVSPPVVVTASRVDDSVARSVIGAKIISALDIERSRATTLNEFLRSTSAIRTRELPGSPNALIDMRGFGAAGDPNTLVLVNGVRSREYEQLSVNWASIPLSSIERIEILPASSAVLHGGGTTGGTINIVTRTPEPNMSAFDFGAGVGSYATRDARVAAGMAGSDAGLRVHGSHYETDNYRDNQRVRIDNAGVEARWSGTAGSLDLRIGGDDQRHGLPSVITEAQIAANPRQAGTPHDFTTMNGGYAAIVAQMPVRSADLAVSLGYRQRDTAASFLVDTPLRNNTDTNVNVWTLSPRLTIEPQFGALDDKIIVGADFEDWRFDSVSQPRIVSEAHSTQSSGALFLQHAIHFSSRTTFTWGAREQHVRYEVKDRASRTSLSSRRHTLQAWDLSLRQALARALAIYGKLGASFRAPNVNDNFNPFLARVTLLEPQTARDSELGLEGESQALRYRAELQRSSLSNEIYFDPLTLGSRNRPPTRRQGFLLEGRWQASSAWEVIASYAYADATFRGGAIGGVSIADNRVPLVPRHTARAGLRWDFTPHGRADMDVRYVGRSVFDLDERNVFGRQIPAYTVADLKVSMRAGAWLLKAGIRNLLGEKYFSYGVVTGNPTYSGTPEAERNVFVSAQYTLH